MRKRVFAMVMVVLFLSSGIAFAETAGKTSSAEKDAAAVEMTVPTEPEGFSEEAKVNPATANEEFDKAVLPEKSDATPQDMPEDVPASK
jgi:hypothetical protein